MKRLLIFTLRISDNGICKILSDFILNFSPNIEVDVLTLESINDIYFRNLNVNILEIGNSKNIFKRIFREYKVLKKGNYDIVHINGDYCSRIVECVVAKIVGIKKIIIHSHNDGIGSNKKLKVLFHKISKKCFDFVATDYFACSNSAAKWMFSNKIFNEKEYKIIKNGINIDKFKFNIKSRQEIRTYYNLSSKYVIGFVGRLTYQKNPLFLIDLFYECMKKKSNLFLLIIGDGYLEEQVIKKIKKLNIEDSVLLLKNIDNIYKYYNAMDCFVLPSIYEGLGIVNIEAQASGLPTIVSNNIPKEAKISDYISYISLDSSYDIWIKKIISNYKIDRKNSYKNVIKFEYDIVDSAKKLEKYYNK